MSGPYAALGQAYTAGFNAYFDYLNKHGGVGGQQVKFTALDDGLDPTTAVSDYKQLVSQGSLAVFGPIGSGDGVAVARMADSSQVPVIGTGVLPPTTKYSFIAGLDATQLMAEELPLVKYLASAKGIAHPRLALVNIDMPAGIASAPIVKKYAAQLGFDVVSSTFAPGAVVTFSTQAAQVAATHPDFVLFTATAASLVIQDRAMRAAGYTGPILNHWNGASNQLLDELKDPQLYVYRDFADPSDPVAAQMRANAKSVGDPDGTGFAEGNYYTEGYVLGELTDSVLKACGSGCTATKFRDLLEGSASKINTDGLTAGQVGFSPSNHIFVHAVRYYHWDPASNIGVPVAGFASASVSQFETNPAPES